MTDIWQDVERRLRAEVRRKKPRNVKKDGFPLLDEVDIHWFLVQHPHVKGRWFDELRKANDMHNILGVRIDKPLAKGLLRELATYRRSAKNG